MSRREGGRRERKRAAEARRGVARRHDTTHQGGKRKKKIANFAFCSLAGSGTPVVINFRQPATKKNPQSERIT